MKVKKSKKKRGVDKVIELKGDTTADRVAFLQNTLMDMLRTGNDVDALISNELGKRIIILSPGFRQTMFARQFLHDMNERNIKAEFEDQLKDRLRAGGHGNMSEYSGKKAVETAVIIAYERSDALKNDLNSDHDDQ